MTDSEIERPLLSIIIPAYNEEARLPASLEQIEAFVAEQDYPVEVIIVNNNSSDATPRIGEAFVEKHPDYARLLHEPRQGKGAAVRTGILAGRGEFLFICDADLSMPIEEVNKFLPPALDSYDVAIASREAPGARRIGEPEYRHLMGRVFNLIVRLFAVPGIQDTQCGFKVFRQEVAGEVFPRQTIDGWGFDVEVLFIARRLGYRLVEVPITWYYRPQSRINPLRDSINMFLEVMRVRLNGWRGLYDRDGS
ncbi:MAG TPA: glycosyltransferase family 2 protein [Chloroflexi bacterium]|nr:glycosyltransferase family 2 protein [Chloroflexota bacterium]